MKRKHSASTPRTKLTLNKQTIRELKPIELEKSAGGGGRNDDALQPGESGACPC